LELQKTAPQVRLSGFGAGAEAAHPLKNIAQAWMDSNGEGWDSKRLRRRLGPEVEAEG
jgi:hypothetical protein